jgi:hypothetical protein
MDSYRQTIGKTMGKIKEPSRDKQVRVVSIFGALINNTDTLL